MRFQMRKCTDCKKYTLKDACPKCGNKTVTVHPENIHQMINTPDIVFLIVTSKVFKII